MDMCFDTAGLSALEAIDGASLGCMFRTRRRDVVKTGEGSGASAGVVVCSNWAFIACGCAGIDGSAMLEEVQGINDRLLRFNEARGSAIEPKGVVSIDSQDSSLAYMPFF